MRKIAIVGAGPGGLAAGMILSKMGHDVTIYEKDGIVGGRSKALKLGDFRFDAGPTFLMYVEILEEVFKKSGYDLHKELNLLPIDPLYKLVFPKVTFEPTNDKLNNKSMYDAYIKGLGDAYIKWYDDQKKKFDTITPLLLRPFDSLFDYLKPDTLRAIPSLQLSKTVYTSLKKIHPNPEFIHSLSFQAKYLGMSSYQAPAGFTFLPFLEHGFGLYHVNGGLNMINEKMAELFVKNGGKLILNAPVEEILVEKKIVYGLKVKGITMKFDDVVINADFSYAMTKLINPKHLKKYKPEKLAKKDYSISTMNIYLALDKVFDIKHHQVVFSNDYDLYLQKILNNEFTDDLSYYIHNPSVMDDTMAPKGQSALYILAPVPNLRSKVDFDTYKLEVEEMLYKSIKERLGIDLKPHIIDKLIITPKDWQDDYNVYLGAVFNLSHKLSQMMHFRPHNKFEEIKNLYLVGGGTHPGSGLPTIYQSAILLKSFIKPAEKNS
ncbi:phytoene desaturase family protein [Acholeplasma granularum]|uniref:phytoene desaturase family protein n=1 Tax=Acholeplasma granularum TaxID=264635 RepID=UPI0004710E59|nr:phytoene desaturase family protein [Acholeplasma granularum]